MNSRTRFFVIASLLVLVVGLGTGLVAYYVGVPGGLGGARGTALDELRFVPKDAAVVAYADVRRVMTSDLRRHFKAGPAPREEGQRQFREQTGIDIENDVDRVVACLNPTGEASNQNALVLARGRFDETKIESLLRSHGGEVQTYRGTRLIVVARPEGMGRAEDGNGTRPRPSNPPNATPFAVAFVEPGLAALGSEKLVKASIDLQAGGQNVTDNAGVMAQVRQVEGSSAWAIGRFDALRAQTRLPDTVAGQIPSISWFSVSGDVDGGLRGILRAEARDEDAANSLRDVVRGFLALAKMQAASKPEMKTMLDSLQLGGTGKNVSLAFDVPAGAFDVLGQMAPRSDTRPR